MIEPVNKTSPAVVRYHGTDRLSRGATGPVIGGLGTGLDRGTVFVSPPRPTMPNKPSRSLNLRQTVFLTLFLMLASVAVGAAALYALQWRSDIRALGRARVLAVADTFSVQAGEVLRGATAQSLADWVRAQLGQPDVLYLAVDDGSGAATTAARSGSPAVQRIAALFRDHPGLLAERLEASDERGRPVTIECHRRVLPAHKSGATCWLMLALRVPRESTSLKTVITTFVLPLMGVSLTGLALGFWWLHRQVLGPLDQLARLARHPRPCAEGDTNEARWRENQIGEIARALQLLHGDLQEWRERVLSLERHIDQRVAAKTNEMTKVLQKVSRQVALDPLTGLYNRRALTTRFVELFRQQVETGHDLSVVMIDLDNFKLLNDRCGHGAGDDILRFVGQLLRQSTRETDLAIRYGGDEFALILTGVNANGALNIAGRIIALFAQHAKLVRVAPKPSLSAGVASIRVHRPRSAAHLLQMADSALYAAKELGKSVVQIYDPQPREAAAVS